MCLDYNFQHPQIIQSIVKDNGNCSSATLEDLKLSTYFMWSFIHQSFVLRRKHFSTKLLWGAGEKRQGTRRRNQNLPVCRAISCWLLAYSEWIPTGKWHVLMWVLQSGFLLCIIHNIDHKYRVLYRLTFCTKNRNHSAAPRKAIFCDYYQFLLAWFRRAGFILYYFCEFTGCLKQTILLPSVLLLEIIWQYYLPSLEGCWKNGKITGVKSLSLLCRDCIIVISYFL